MKCANFVGPFDPFRRPAPGRPSGFKHLCGPRLGWYRSRPGASRRGEYPNGSNIKNIRFVMKCTNFVGPFDPFRRPAPGRPLGSKHPQGPRLGWYRSRPGASRRGENPNRSNIKNIRFVMKCTNFVGPFDPFRRPSPIRPPGSKHPWGPRLGWYRSRPWASRRGEYPNGSNIKNIRFVMKCTNFVGPFNPFRRPAPGRPPGSKHTWGPRLGWYRSRPGASRRGEYPNGSNIKNIRFVMKCTNFVGPFDPFRRPAPKRPPGSKHPWGPRLGWYRSRPGASRRGEYPNGSNIKNIRFVMKCNNFVGPFDPFRRPPGSKHPWGPRSGWYRSRPGASRRGEYPNGSNIKNIRFVMKCTNFVGPFDPFRRPAPGRPPGSKHPWGPRSGWYRSRPGASRRGEYPNGSNIKNIRFVMKCTNFVGPFDPFRRPAPGRPPGSKHPWGPRLGWYRSRPGASRRGEYPNGSNIKNIRFVMKCTNFVGPFDPFRRPAPGRPPGSKHPWGSRLGWYRSRPGASRRGEYPNGSNIKNIRFVMKCTNFVGPFDPFRRPAPGRPPDSKHPWGPRLGWYRSRPGASRRGEYPNGSNIKNIRFVMKCTNFVGPFDPFRRPAPGRPPGSKHPWGPRLGWYRSRPGASRRGEYPNGSNIKNIRFVMKCTNFVGPFDPFRRPAPGRPPGSKHPWGPRLGWYRSRPGASRRGEYPNGSNIKNIRFVMKCTNLVGPFDPFRRPAPGRPPGSKHPREPRLGWYRFRPGASRRGEYPNGSNIKNIRFVMKCTNFVGPFDPFRRPAARRPPGSKHPRGP